jgi:hypothetical protein
VAATLLVDVFGSKSSVGGPKTGSLFEKPEFLMQSELKEPHRYASIVAAILNAIGGCSGVRMPPPKHCNKEACDHRGYLEAHFCPVPDWRGVSVSNPNRRV